MIHRLLAYEKAVDFFMDIRTVTSDQKGGSL